MRDLGTVSECWRYPVKSFQGAPVEQLNVQVGGVDGDRRWALFDRATQRVLSAKRVGKLLHGIADEHSIRLPDASRVDLEGPDASRVLSDWLGRDVALISIDDISDLGVESLSYQMTFDPPDDDAEYYDIPMPTDRFVDLAPLHLMTTATLNSCERRRPDLNWDVRRFRPNLLLAIEADAYVEETWIGRPIQIGTSVVIETRQPTVRCAMPLRTQPALGERYEALDRQTELFRAMNELRNDLPNHLGVYADVISPGVIRVGDTFGFV